jgi:TonB family protein
LPGPSIASGNLELQTTAILREPCVDDPAQNPAADDEKIHAPTTSPIERPVQPIVFSEQVSPAAQSPSQELAHPEEEPPRRRKWTFLVENSPSQDAPPIQKAHGEIPRRAVGSTYIERLTDAILRKNSVDVSPKNPIATNQKISARTDIPTEQPSDPIVFSEKVSAAAPSPSVELPPPPPPPAPAAASPAPALQPPPAAVALPEVQPPSASAAELVATRDQTPKTFISSSTEEFPRSGERRLLLRQRICSLAYLEVGSDNGGMVLDLSECGLALQAFNPLIGLTRVNLRIQPPKSRKRIVVAAEIIWLSESQTEAGLKFLELPEDARMEIADWLAAEATVSEPPLADNAASHGMLKVPSTPVVSPPASEKRQRSWDEWFPLFGDLNPQEALARHDASGELVRTSTGSEDFALQPGTADSQKLSEHPVRAPETFLPASNVSDTPISSSAFPESVPDVRRSALRAPVPVNAASRPFVSEQFRKWGTIAALCACVALVFLFLGMAISRALSSDRATRSSAEEHTRDADASRPAFTTSASPASPVTSGQIDASSAHTASPSESAASITPHLDTANISRASQIEVRDRHNRDDSQPRMPGGETASPAAMPPSTNAALPEAAKSDAQISTVSSLPVWSVQAAANHDQPASTPATNPAPVGVPERRSDCYLLYRVEPLYPREAHEQRIEGTVMVRLQIGTDGRVRSSRELSGPAPLVPAALAAVREWRFIPALLNGQPIEAEKDVSIEFQLSR